MTILTPFKSLGFYIWTLKEKKVPMLLDEVESQCQKDALDRAGWLEGSESRILVSTTDPRLASGPKVTTFEVPLSSCESSHRFRIFNYVMLTIALMFAMMITFIRTTCTVRTDLSRNPT
jgi:hypothetical protein